MRVLIAGGTGFLGRALTQSLLEDGHEIVVLTRSPHKSSDARVRFVGWDGKSTTGWGEVVNEVDAVVNLTGENLAQLWTKRAKERMRSSRVNAGRALTEAIRAATHRPRVLLQSSAVGYYGPRGDEPVTESTGPGTDYLARLVTEWEASTAEVESMGVRRVIIRTGLAFDKREGVFPYYLLPFRMVIAGGPLGSGKQYVPWLHRDDHVRAMRFLLENDDAKGVFNLSSPNPVRQVELSRALGKVMRRPSFMPAPAFAMRLALGEMSGLVLEGQRQLPQRLLDMGFAFRHPDLVPALEDLLK